MKPFMDKDFILNSDTAKELYHNTAAKLPIIDYHCHIDAKEIAEDRVFDNIAQVWLGGDHYKWRAMRICGTPENLVTGDAPDKDKFFAFAAAAPKMVGSPLYHWAHLELQRYFDITTPLSEATAEEIWNECNKKLKTLSARKMIEKSNVEIICTTNDPTEDLIYHQQIAKDKTFATKVYPAFRPDKAVNIDKPDFAPYIKTLAKVWGKDIKTFADVKAAIISRIDYFANNGCRAADHGLDFVPFGALDDAALNKVFKKAMQGKPVTKAEADAYKTALIACCANEYTKRDWVMEVHYGVMRNVNSIMFNKLGADTGYDTVNQHLDAENLAKLLDHLLKNNALPRTVIFPIDPSHNTAVETIAGAFQAEGICGRVQQGAAWWFNDTKIGMETQLKAFSDLSVLGCFIGMLTDSRSFLSYTRHEYFRRILCNYIGELVDKGEYPYDLPTLEKIVADICHDNAKAYFGWDK